MSTVPQFTDFCKVDDLTEVREGKLSRDTVYSLIRQNKVAVLKLSSRRWRVRRDWFSRMADDAR